MKIFLNHVWFNISAALVLSGITSVAVAANEKENPPPRAYEDRVYVNDERLPNYGDTRPRTYGSYSTKNGNSVGGRSSPAKEKSSSDANTAPSQGGPDWKANIPTMPGAYLDAVKKEGANSFRALDMGFREWEKLPRFRR